MKAYLLSIMNDERKTIDGYAVGIFLSIAAAAYSFLLRCVYFLYRINILRSHKMRAKVISVGNITLGGTGKTPFVIALAENIKAMGKKPAVLSGGYGNDESHLLEERLQDLPVLTGKNRVKNAEIAENRLGSNCVILDDGFQHYRIKRDLDIILIDATCPFGNMKLFPRGILREPLARLKDADIAILTKCDMGRGNIDYIRNILKRFNDKIEIAESFYQPVGFRKLFFEELMPVTCIKDKRIALLAGIANTRYFEWMAGSLGAEIAEKFYYTDHYQYKEKDAVRLKRLKNITQEIEIFVLRIDFRISSNEKIIANRLHSVFNS